MAKSSRFGYLFVRTTLLRRGLSIHHFYNFFPRPNPVSQTSGHSRRPFLQALVLAKPVVPDSIDSNHVCMVLELLGKGVRQARKPAHVHPHGQILPLGIGRADMRRIGRAFDRLLLDPGAIGRAVAALG